MIIPKKYRNQELYCHCNKCYKNWQEKAPCKHKDNWVFISRLYNPVTKRIGKTKTHGTNFHQALEDHIFLKMEYVKNGFEIVSRKKETFPKILTQCVSSYIEFLKDIDVPDQNKKKRSAGYINDNIYYLTNFLDCMALKRKPGQMYSDAVNQNHVGEFHNWLEGKGYANRTYNANMDALQYCYDYIIHKGRLDIDNPFKSVTRKPIKTDPRSLSDEEINLLLSVVTPENSKGTKGKNKVTVNHYDQFIKDFIKASLLIGSRISEILQIKNKHVLLERGLIRVPASAKGSKEFDDTFIPVDLAEILPRFYGEPEDYLFYPDRKNRKTLAVELSKAFRHFADIAGLGWATFHTLRKTWITRAMILFNELGFKNDKNTAIKNYLDQGKMSERFSAKRMFFEKV